MKTVTRVLAAVALLMFAACASSGSAGPDLTGPYPSVTAVIRADADGGRLELLGVRVSAVELREAATQLATDLFGAENAGQASPTFADTEATPDTLLSTSVPVTIPTAGMQLAIDETTVEAALQSLKPRSTAVWACSERRTIQVATQAPGAVSSDVVSGACQVAGSSIANDGIDWTAMLTVGPITPASLVLELVWSSALLLLIAAIATFVWIRRARRRGVVSVPDAAPVH